MQAAATLDRESQIGTNGGPDAIVLCGEDVIALWPRLVLTESGAAAPPLARWTGMEALEPSAVVGDAGFQVDAGSPTANRPESSEFSSLNAPLASSVDQLPPTRSRTARLAERVAAEFLQGASRWSARNESQGAYGASAVASRLWDRGPASSRGGPPPGVAPKPSNRIDSARSRIVPRRGVA